MKETLPKRYNEAYGRVEKLQQEERYLGAFIFGSGARGDITDDSDFDVKVIVDEDNSCTNINHPVINGIKLDLTFQSFAQLKSFTEAEVKKGERIPMVAESVVIFDITGELTELRKQAQEAKPKKATSEDHQIIQFMIYHTDNKVSRLMKVDEAAAIISMGLGIGELIKNHYFIQGKWRVSDKRLFTDLEQWDPELLDLLRECVLAPNTESKYGAWGRAIDYILAPIGGRQPISENNCHCEVCTQDLKQLLG